MRKAHSTIQLVLLAILAAFAVTPAAANPPKKPKPATTADVDRVEKKLEDLQRQVDKLLKTQQLYREALNATLEGQEPPPALQPPGVDKPPAMLDKPASAPAIEKKPPAPAPKASIDVGGGKPFVEQKKPKKEKLDTTGTIVGKVSGVSDAIVYIEDIVAPVKGSAAMKQEDKQFVPQVLVVTKGSNVTFPNRDAIFHNVFSVTPDNSFDLGSYKQGESRSVTMTKAGVVTVYCNMHPQMVGHILVVPNSNYVRAGKDGFFRLTNVPPGPHRVVAWAPNAQPTVVQATVEGDQVATIELSLKRGRSGQHVKKDGLPYGSYEK